MAKVKSKGKDKKQGRTKPPGVNKKIADHEERLQRIERMMGLRK